MKNFRNILVSTVTALAVVPGIAAAAPATWNVNYTDANAAGALGITLTNPISRLTDEYKYTAESLVLFNDNDNSGGISGGDTFDDKIGFIIDQLNLGGVNTFDPDYAVGNVQITGILTASGTQLDPLNYIVNTATIDFYFDGVPATFADFDTLVDGLYVQTGTGSGAGVNGALIPDGAINIDFALTDILSTLNGEFGPFELFNPFANLDSISFQTDSNNNACPPAVCGSSVAGLEAFFGVNTDDYDFFFQTRSDGSAVKQVPEPAILALFSLGLLGLGFARRRSVKS